MTGKITSAFGRYYTVRSNGTDVNAVLRGKIKSDPRLKNFSEPVAVGDTVDYTINIEGLAVIENIHERRNVFTRKDRSSSKEDLIAANIDQLFVVQSFRDPKFNLRFADRLFVRAAKENLPAVLCMNKADLAVREDSDYISDYYARAKIPFLEVSAATGYGREELLAASAGKISLFAGYSGVGKSSLLNSLFPGIELRTSEISGSTGKGRHTTTNVRLIEIGEGTSLIDTPGMREFGLLDIKPENLCLYFPDMLEYNRLCRFAPCTHDHEPGCRVKEAVESGEISSGRYESYTNILYSIKEYYANMY
jgi:ribosome biogenesis GTPase